MQGTNQYRAAVRGMWEHGHDLFEGWPLELRAPLAGALDALTDWLADAEDEDELVARYLADGDPPWDVLRPHLPDTFTQGTGITLQNVCFWRRLTAIEAAHGAV